MKEIITDIEVLARGAEPLEFITEAGNDTAEGDEIIAALKDTLLNTPGLIALAAPQIGYNKRIFCIRFDDVIKTFINPIIKKKNGAVIAPESCASLPGKEILLARPNEVTVIYYTDEYKYEDNKLLGAAARIFDQMAQILDGVLPSDIGLVSDVAEDGSLSELSEEEMNQVVEIYKQFAQAKLEAAKKAIEADPDLESAYRKLKFTEDVINGRTLIIQDDKKPNRETRRAVRFNKVKPVVSDKPDPVRARLIGGRNSDRRKN